MGIPEVVLSSTSPATGARAISVLAMGTGLAHFTTEQRPATKHAILRAIELGYRHFDTAASYQSEDVLGEAIAEALQASVIHSRAELFITSKIWCADAHRDLVLLKAYRIFPLGARNLKLDYLDLYLIHWPMRLKAEKFDPPIESHHILPFDLKSVWEGMEECQRLGLAKHIGVSNFTTWKLAELLQYAKVPPAAVQVEMNPTWQQKKLREFCKEKGVHVIAYSPLGGQDMFMGKNLVMESQVLKDIAKAKGKTVAQVALLTTSSSC
ncbi:hypothetical protein BHE74_00024742 [Ensete ventricosum]|nr:hypothetical protein BHE74_00024742 [Ensete ventricosum]